MPIQDEIVPATGEKVLAVKVPPTSRSTPEMAASKSNEPEGAASIMLQSVSPISEAPQPSTSFSASYRSAPGGPVKIAKTAAERQRERRDKLRESGEYDKYKKKAAERRKILRKKKLSMENEEEKRIRREKDRINHIVYRFKQKEKKSTSTLLT